MDKIKVLLLFGGESSEHEVSVSSAGNVFEAIDKNKYDVKLCLIDKSGKWWLVDKVSDFKDTDGLKQILPQMGERKFLTIGTNEEIVIDVILPILHGTNGEDGTVQGLAKLMKVPIVGCDLTSSAICMDKVFAKQILEFNGIKTAPFEVHLEGDPLPDFNEILRKLGAEAVFVKPANSGSSVGVSLVSGEEEYDSAISLAHKHDSKVLIEKALIGREIEIAILGTGKSAEVSGPGEIKPDREFYNYDSKYDSNSKTEVIIPARLPNNISDNVKSIALKAYSLLGCSGFSRIDFFLVNDRDIYLNEINTIPGFTNISMYPKLWINSGISYKSLIDMLIVDALEK
jgi:D-alanine-D-alanine ligase